MSIRIAIRTVVQKSILEVPKSFIVSSNLSDEENIIRRDLLVEYFINGRDGNFTDEEILKIFASFYEEDMLQRAFEIEEILLGYSFYNTTSENPAFYASWGQTIVSLIAIGSHNNSWILEVFKTVDSVTSYDISIVSGLIW